MTVLHRARRAIGPPSAPVLGLACLALSVSASAYNRNDVFAELARVPDDWPENRVEVRIEGDPDDPVVAVGEPLTLLAEASRPSHFTLVLVDPRGEVSVLAPEALTSRADSASRSTTFPPPGSGQLLQGEPAGLQSVYLVASERRIPPERLGIDSGSDIVTLGRDAAAIADLADALSDGRLTGRRGIDRYAWLVDADVEVGTRAMRRELEMRVRQVDVMDEEARTGAAAADTEEAAASAPLAISDIRFATGRAELTDIGRTQLDIVASEVLRQGENRAEPLHIALEGHTDDVGETAYNDALSLARAESAKRYLVDVGGLTDESIEISGRGEREPRVANVDAASRALNRRVEIRVLAR